MTENEIVEVLRARRLPEAVLALWAGRRPSGLPPFWAKPRTYFLAPDGLGDVVPGLSGLVPIVEHNGEAIIGVLPDEDRYVRFYYEDGRRGDAAIEELGHGYAQFAMTVLVEMAEYLEEKEEFIAAARLLEFDQAGELWALCEANDEEGIAELFARLAPGGSEYSGDADGPIERPTN